MGTIHTNATDTMELGEVQCVPYVLITMVAQFTMLIQLILLGITIHFILTKTSVNLQHGEQKRNTGVLKRLKEIIPITWCSSSSEVILIASRRCSQQIQPYIEVEEQTHAQLNDSSEPQTSIAHKKESSPMPPVPKIELPAIPSYVNQNSQCCFEDSDEDHAYAYIQLPINKNQQQHKPPKEQERENMSFESNISERLYDTLQFMPSNTEGKESKHSDYNVPKETASESLYDTFEIKSPQAEGKESKQSDNKVSENLYDTFVPVSK